MKVLVIYLVIKVYLQRITSMKHSYKIALSYATENEDIVKKVYHYLKADGIAVFFAPAPECQIALSGKNQREIFYEIFGLKAEYVALFISQNYIMKKVPMEEASIAIAKHRENGRVIPIYMDDSVLPEELFNPMETNYFKSNNAAEIANHLAVKVRATDYLESNVNSVLKTRNTINITNNRAENQIFVGRFEGNINL